MCFKHNEMNTGSCGRMGWRESLKTYHLLVPCEGNRVTAPTLYWGILLWQSKPLLTMLLLRQALQRTQSGHKLLVSMITLNIRKEGLTVDSLATLFSVLVTRSLILKLEVWEVLKVHLNSAQNGSPLSEFCTICMRKGCRGTCRSGSEMSNGSR